MTQLQQRVHEILEGSNRRDRTAVAFQAMILVLIIANAAGSIVATVPSIEAGWSKVLFVFEAVSVGVFALEYVGRVWSCVVDQRYAHPVFGRLRFMLTPMALVDLIAVLPFVLGFLAVDLRVLRILRLARILRVTKLGRYNSSFRILGAVVREKREELVMTLLVMMLLVVISATLMYYAEHEAQPKVFCDVPSAMWWAVATLTTVGYGDIYPVTPLGRLIAAVVAVLGIGFFALPAGILGAGFVEEMHKHKPAGRKHVCPKCGHTSE